MPPAFRSVTHVGTGGDVLASLTVAKPAGTTTDDLLLAVVRGLQGTAPTASGFTLLGSTGPLYFLAKIAGASEPSSYVFSFGAGDDHWDVTLAAYSGTAPSLSGSASLGFKTGVGTSAATEDVAVPSADCLMVVGVHSSGGTYQGVTPPSGCTERADNIISSTEGLEISDVLSNTSGTSGVLQATFPDSRTWRTGILVWLPAGAGGGGSTQTLQMLL